MHGDLRIALDDALARQPRAPVLLGFSGGLDSTALLHLLAADADCRAHGLRALHVHHGLHADADHWAAHCRASCDALGIALDIVRVTLPREGGDGLEAAARAARHAAFAGALGEGEVLALAHHRDDQAETFLLRALRASGDGLGAMAPWRAFHRGRLWRPLLDVPRSHLLDYARAHGLAWIEDPSNADDAHDRNFLRNRVMPLLRTRWPQADAAFAHSANLARDAAVLLDTEDACALAKIRSIDPACLDAAGLVALPAPRRARVLRRWIAGCGLPPLPASGMAAIECDLLAGRDAIGDAPAFRWRDAVVRRWRGLLWAEREQAPLPPDLRIEWRSDAALALPGGGTLRMVASGPLDDAPGHPQAPWIVHARTGGERITLPGRAHSHALKHVLQALGVPPWERAALPLLFAADGALEAAGDLVLSARLDGWLRARGAGLRWLRTP